MEIRRITVMYRTDCVEQVVSRVVQVLDSKFYSLVLTLDVDRNCMIKVENYKRGETYYIDWDGTNWVGGRRWTGAGTPIDVIRSMSKKDTEIIKFLLSLPGA